VSIDRYPSSNTSTVTGTTITPNQTYIGGTGGNGLTYFSGSYPNVSTEISYESGDIFNSEYSKILPKAAYFSSSSGSLFRTADVTTGNSNLVDWVVNTKKQDVQSLTNTSYSIAGTPFKMWENLGSYPDTPDSLVFYNDTAIARSSIPTGSLTTATSFSFSIGRPQPTALIDYITVRAGTVVVAATPSQVAVNPSSGLNTKTLTIVMSPTYTVSPTSTVSYVAPIASISGYTGAASSFSVVLNPNNLDQIYISLAGPLYTVNPTASPAVPAGGSITDYMRVTATVYYRYPAGSTIKIVDNSISTKSSTLTTTTPTSGVLSWNNTVTVGSSTVPVINPVLKLATGQSARMAMAYASAAAGGSVYSIRVTNAPLDLNTPISFVNVSQDKCLSDDQFGNPTTNTVNVIGKPTVLEWGKSGKNLYYATDAGSVSYLYRVSHLNTLVDSTAKGYGGKLHTNVFKFNSSVSSPTQNPMCPYRTTLLGTFPNKITSISVPSNDTLGLVLTFNDPSPTGTLVMVSSNTANIQKSDSSNIGFANKTPSVMANRITYCSLLEKNDPRKTYVGTDNGIFYTDDVTAATPNWMNINAVSTNTANWLPNVQIFDMKQQTLDKWNCYNSGQIYVATNGRGIWVNNDYYVPTVVSVNEIPKTATTENNLTLYPNPTNGNVNISFNGISGETAKITVYDVNGRIVKTEDLGKIYTSEVNYTFETTNIATGLYIIHVTSDSGIKRVAKLVVTK
ncbi:MAG: T9SS type A sorting domain-containing protein, partial [Bacteroidia bacterium]